MDESRDATSERGAGDLGYYTPRKVCKNMFFCQSINKSI